MANDTKSYFYEFYDKNGERYKVNSSDFDADMAGFKEAYPGTKMRMVDKKGNQWDVPVENVQSAMNNGGYRLYKGMTVVKSQPKKSPVVQKALSKAKPIAVPEGFGGFGDFDVNEASKPAFLQNKEKVVVNPQTGKGEKIKETNPVKEFDKALKSGKLSGSPFQQIMDALEYEKITGKPLEKPFNDHLTAPTVKRDKNGKIITNENGEPIIGSTSDPLRVAEYNKELKKRELKRLNEELIKPITQEVVSGLDKELTKKASNALISALKNKDLSLQDRGIMTQQEKSAYKISSPENLLKELNKKYGANLDEQGNSKGIPTDFVNRILSENKDYIERSAAKLNVPVEDFVWNNFIPQVSQQIAESFHDRMEDKYSIKDTADYLTRKFASSSLGTLASMQTTSKMERQLMNEEMFKTEEGKGKHYNAGFGTRIGGTIAMFAGDGPLLSVTGKAGALGTKAIGKGIELLGKKELGRIVATGSPFLAANVGKVIKYGGTLAGNISRNVGSMSLFMGTSGALQDISAGDGSLASIGSAAAQGAKSGALFGAFTGVFGTATSALGSKIGKVGQRNIGKNIAFHGTAFGLENQGFAFLDYIEDPDNFNWVESTADAFYMQLGSKFSSKHGIKGVANSFKEMFATKKDAPAVLTPTDKKLIQDAFGGMDFVDIAADMNNVGKILEDKEVIPWTTRMKVSTYTTQTCEPNRPRTDKILVTDKIIDERAENNELIESHPFSTEEEKQSILTNIQERRDDYDMKADFGKLSVMDAVDPSQEEIELAKQEVLEKVPSLRPEDVEKGGKSYDLVLDRARQKTDKARKVIVPFAEEYGMTEEEVMEIFNKKPIERTDEEVDLMTELAQRLHDAAYPQGQLHSTQSHIDGRRLASSTPEITPEIAENIAKDVNEATEKYNKFLSEHDAIRETVEMMADRRPDEIIQYIYENFSGSERDEAVSVISDYYNALSMKEGYISKVGDNIESTVSEEINRNIFKGTINDEEDKENIITITDGKGEYTLINAKIGVTEDGRVDAEKSSGIILARDSEGNIVQFTPDSKITIKEKMPYEAYGNGLREELQLTASEEALKSGLVEEPKEEKKEEPKKEEQVEGIGEEPIEEQKEEPVVSEEPTINIEDVTDKDGVKHYENGIDHDTAIKDMQDDGIDPMSMADAMISSSQKTIEKWANKKDPTPADVVKGAKETKEAQNTINYWTELKNGILKKRAEEMLLQEKEREEARVRAAQEKTEKAKKEQEERISSDERFANNKERFMASREDGDEDTIVLANGETIEGRYVLVDANALTPSHNPRGNFQKSEGFPVDENGKTINDRDYENDKTAQTLVQKRSQAYDQRAVNTPVVVSEDGIVLSGNDRTMSGQLAADNKTDGAYVSYITKHAKRWGFTPEQVSEKKNPRIVFVPNERMEYNAETFAKFNQDEKKSQNTLETSVKMGKVLATKPETIGRIGSIIDQVENLSDLYESEELTAEVVKALRDGGIVTDENLERLLTNGRFSAQGKDEFETMLAGVVVDEDALRLLSNPENSLGDLRKSIAYATVALVKNSSLGDYPIVKEVSEAVKLYNAARKAKLVDKNGDITNYFINNDAFDGAPMDTHSLMELMLASNMSKGGYYLKRIIEEYNREAQAASAGQVDMWSGGIRSKEEILSDILKSRGYDAETIKQRIERLTKAQPTGESNLESGERGGGKEVAEGAEARTSGEHSGPEQGERVEKDEYGDRYVSYRPSKHVEELDKKANELSQQVYDKQKERNILLSDRTRLESEQKGSRGNKRKEIQNQIDEIDRKVDILNKEIDTLDDAATDASEKWDEAEYAELKRHFESMSNEDLVRLMMEKEGWESDGNKDWLLEDNEYNAIIGELTDRGISDAREAEIRKEIINNRNNGENAKKSGKLQQIDRELPEDYLKPRDDKEAEIVSKVEEKLQDEIKEQQEKVNKAKQKWDDETANANQRPELGLFGDEVEKREKKAGDQTELFEGEEKPAIDNSEENIRKQAKKYEEEYRKELQELERLQSDKEHDSRVRGALDEARRQTSFEDADKHIDERHKEDHKKYIEPLLGKSDEELRSLIKEKEEAADHDRTKLVKDKEYVGAVNILAQRMTDKRNANMGKVWVDKNERGEDEYTTKQGNQAYVVTEYNKNNLILLDGNLILTGEETEKGASELYEKLEKLGKWKEGINRPGMNENQSGWIIPKDKASELDRILREHLEKLPKKGENRYNPNPVEKIEQTAEDFRKEQDKEMGVTRNETPEEIAKSKGEEILNDEKPLTAEEIDNSSLSKVQKTWAKSYLKGDTTNELYLEAYLEAYEDVRNRRQQGESDSSDAQSAAQLAGTEDSGESGLGRVGESDGGMAVESNVPEQELGRPEQGGIQRTEDSKDNVSVPSGEQSNSGVSGEESNVHGVSSGSVESVRSSSNGGAGHNVRSAGGDTSSDRVAGEDRKRDIKTRRSELKNKRDELLAKLKALKEQEKKDDAGKLQMAILPPLPSGISDYIPKNKEQRAVFWDLATTTADYGYTYLEEGITKFNEWKDKIYKDFVEPIRDYFGWGQNAVDRYIQQVWDSDYDINGVTRKMSEWASLLGEKELRKTVKLSNDEKFKLQQAAESVEVKTGDIDNIRESLPYLLPEQQDDVLKTEKQFFDESHQDREHGFGKGMMFTNGTGTGKTYTGLGIVKRFVKQGKGRVLIITPSQPKVKDWKEDGRNLGLEIEDLDEAAKKVNTTATKAKGSGVVITTFNNARQNLKLLEDCFDLVVYDESHKIVENQQANETTMLKFHEMLTNKDVESSIDRQTYYLPLWVEERNLKKEQEIIDGKLNSRTELTDEERAKLDARLGEIMNRLTQIYEEKKPIRESKRQQAEIDTKKTKTVFLSATPFVVREALKYAEGYLFSYPEENKNTIGSYNHRSPEQAFMEQTFPAGYRWRYGRLESHVENADALARQEVDFSDYLQNNLQTMSGRMIESEWDYSRDFPILTLDNAGRFNEVMSEIYRNRKYQPLADVSRKIWNYIDATAIFECMKSSLVAERVKEHLSRGRKVVIFHRRRTTKNEIANPFARMLEAADELAALERDDNKKSDMLSAIAAFEHDFKDILEWEKTIDYTMPREQFTKIFGEDNVALFSGDESGKNAKSKNINEFMKDNAGKDIIVVQESSGKEGLSLHDQTGKHQRVEINLALPQSPIAFIQQEGRIYRIGQKSNAIFEYPLLGLDLETSLFAEKFNAKLGTTENLALGSKARNLRESVATSVLENTGLVDYDNQGLGGKDLDGRVSASNGKDGFDIAISDYYGNQKITGKRDNREGFDYYPTPEPIGYKMVEFGQLLDGESALEPSAGHGAIARYVPGSNPMTAIEPSSSLFSKLQMRAGGPGRRFEEMTFEQYPLQNKHDVILMNPPYGVGGKMAIDHVAKAFRHLNEGGRIVAIIPNGPATEKHFNKWIESRNENGVEGVNGAAVVVAEVKLPSIAFSRAGTAVNTKIVVIDKVSRPEMRKQVPEKVDVDLTHANTVEELFDGIRNTRVPERTIDQVAINEKRAKKTEKLFKDNPMAQSTFVGDTYMGNVFVVTSRSRDLGIRIKLDNLDMADIFRTYQKLKEGYEKPEGVDWGKWTHRTFGSGKNKVPALDAIRDYCDAGIKTIANILKTTEDGLDKKYTEYMQERERKEQEYREQLEREREERARQLEEKIKPLVETALSENKELSEPIIAQRMREAHGRIPSMANIARKSLANAGVDWQTGHKITNKSDNLNSAYNDEMPLDLETMQQLMYIADNSIDSESRRSAKLALEMSGIHSETGEAKEGFDYSSHDEYYEKDLQEYLKKASKMVPLKTKAQKAEESKAKEQTSTSDYEYKLDKNTRTGEDMHLVKYNGERLSSDEYRATERKAKSFGGYYNRFKKAFHFPTEEDARKFVESLNETTTRFRASNKEEKLNKEKKVRVIPEIADKDVSLRIEKDFDKEVDSILNNLDEKERNEELSKLDDKIFQYSVLPERDSINRNGVPVQGLETRKKIQQERVYGEKSVLPEVTERGNNIQLDMGYDRRGISDVERRLRSRLNLAAINRELQYREERRKEFDEKYGIKDSEPISIETLRKIFTDNNSDKSLVAIFDAAEKTIKELQAKVHEKKIDIWDIFGEADVPGKENFYDFKKLLGTGYSKQDMAWVVLHEMLHQGTSHAIALYNNPKYRDNLSIEQQKACKEIIDLYKEAKNHPEWFEGGSRYGLENEYEFAAEASNQNIRNGLSKQNFLQKLWGCIKSLFGLKATKLERLDDSIMTLLDTFSKEQYDMVKDNNFEFFNHEGKPMFGKLNLERMLGKDVDETYFRSKESKQNTVESDFARKEEAGRKIAEKLNVDFEAVTNRSQIKNREALAAIEAGRKVTGWFEVGKDGKKKIVLYLPNVENTYEAEKTIAHETVGHYGMRELLGEDGYKSYMRSLLLDLKNPELSKYMEEHLALNGFDVYRTIDEFLADAAEKGYGNLNMWQKVKEVVVDALRSQGFKMAPSISDVKYMVWLSKHNLEKGNIISDLERSGLLYKLSQEKYEANVKNGEFTYSNKVEEKDNPYVGEGVPYFPGQGRTLFRQTPSVKNQKQNYDRALRRFSYVWKEAHIDAMQSAVELARAISGIRKVEDIPSAENFILAENQMSSKEEQMDFLYNRDFMKPLDKAVSECLPDMGKGVDEQLRNLQLYMIKKHGLERNRILYVRDRIREMRNDPTADQSQVDNIENNFYNTIDGLRQDLKNGSLNLQDFYQNLDKWIEVMIDPNYVAAEHDYSGLSSVNGTKGVYDDGMIIDDVMSTEAMLGENRVNNLWEKTKAVSQFGLDMEYEGGLDSKEKHDKVSNMFEWYVPLRGYNEKTAEEVYDYLEENGNGKGWAGPVLMNAKGRTSLSDVDVFATLGAMNSSAISRALKNQMKLNFARFIRNHYNDVDSANRLVTELPILWAEKQYDPQTGREVWVEKFPDIPEDAKADDVAQIIDAYQKDMKAKEQNGDAKRMRQSSHLPFRPADPEHKSQHIVDVWINGEKHAFIVNGNPRAAQAINGQLKDNKHHTNLLWMSNLSHFMAKMNTSYSPDFIMRNTERDLIFSAANVAVKESPKYWLTWAKNYAVATGRAAFGVPAAHTNLFKRYRNDNLNLNNPTDKYFKEFMENGGETGFVERKNLDKWKKIIKEGVTKKTLGEKAVNNIVSAIPSAIEAMNERAENLARFATYMTSRQMGRSIVRSVSDAKEVSVNFNRKGAGGNSAHFKNGRDNWFDKSNAYTAGWLAQYLQDYTMFYNAGVQGLNNMAKMVRDHPFKATSTFAAFALAAMLMPKLNKFLIDDDDNRDVKDPYAELPEWVRRNNLCIYNGDGGFITIALPIELRAFYGIGDMAASFISNPELRSTKNAGVDIITQLSQIAPLDFMGEGAGPQWTVVPTGIRTAAEAAANTNWLGQPIEREETPWNKEKPRWTRAFKNVNDVFINTSKSINAITNPYGDENIKGWADGAITDPALIQHIVEGYFGGAGKAVLNLAQMTKHGLISGDMSVGELVKSNWMPVVRTLHYTPNERTRYARTRNRWNYYRDEADKTNETIKVLEKKGHYDPLSYMKQISEEEGEKGKRAIIMQRAMKDYDYLRKALNKTTDLELKNTIQLQMDALMENTVRELDKIQ